MARQKTNQEFVPPDQPTVPVVGVGASAGPEAVSELLAHLPPSTGLAFVYVDHHGKAGELVEALQRHSPIPVTEIQSGAPLHADHLYVAPEDAFALLQDGALQLERGAAAGREARPVDVFFASLAAARKHAAIGVILSGSAIDGVAGVREIKEQGGIIFVQDPQTAAQAGMPTGAIASGYVDHVLPVKEIADELAAIGRHPFLAANQDGQPGEEIDGDLRGDEDLYPILSLLRSRSGLDLSLYKRGTIERRIERRMVLARMQSFQTYWRYLRHNPGEAEALIDDLLINVTSFFRDPEVFDVLKRDVFPKLVRLEGAVSPIRIWVPGCSTGQEAYSIAICFSEFLEETRASLPVQIFGSDVSESAIEKARAGVYPPQNILSELSQDRTRRFFTEIDHGYQIGGAIRDLCVFSTQNIASDPPFSRIDLLSCRNVLIYFGPQLQKRAMNLFHYALKPSGFLMLGNSESLGAYGHLFARESKSAHVFVKKEFSGGPAVNFRRLERYSEALRPLRGDGQASWSSSDIHREADRLVLGRFVPPAVLINEDGLILEFRGPTGPYLEAASGDASLSIYKMAREGLLMELRAAIASARKENAPVTRSGLQVKSDGGYRDVKLEVIPIKNPAGSGLCLLVVFVDVTAPPVKPGRAPKSKAGAETAEQLQRAREELSSTRRYLQSIIEEQEITNAQLKAASEEIQSANEELQSSNEELETAKEELQSANEELTTVNEELQNRNLELMLANSDLNNLLGSVSIPMVMVGNDLRIRRFSPLAEKVLNILASDAGRPIMDLRLNINLPDLAALLVEAIDHLKIQERQIQDVNGAWYNMFIRPYKSGDNKIAGAIVSLVDIDTVKRNRDSAQAARDFAEAVLDTVQDSLLVLDDNFCVKSGNRVFFQTFELRRADVEGQPIHEIESGEFDLPGLRELLEEVRDSDARIQDVEIEREFSRLGSRVTQINARRIQDGLGDRSILLVITDITHRKRASEGKYRRLFETARDGILLAEADSGRIADVNPYMVEWLGFPRNELLRRPFWQIGMFADAEATEFMYRQVQRDGARRYESVRLHTRAGGSVDAEIIASLYHERDCQMIHLNFRDVTERRLAEERIRSSLRDKELLLQEIHHRVKNNLQVISSILSLQSRYVQNEQALQVLNETRNRVLSIATIHEMLYRAKGLARIEMGEYIRKLAANLFDTYGVTPGSIHLEVDAGSASLGIDKAIPCGLIINELLSNCLKHAGMAGQEGRITVLLKLEGAGSYVLSVKDNGAGLPRELDLSTLQSLGLQMVQLLAEQLNGSAEFVSRAGLEVTIRFPGAGPDE